MNQKQQTTNEINKLTLIIEQEYPELYQFLDESPTTITTDNYNSVNSNDLSDYLDSLKQLLKHHIENNKTKQ